MSTAEAPATRLPRRGALALYERLTRRGLFWPPVVVAIAVIVGSSLSASEQLKWTLWIAYGLLALSLDLVWGRAGIFSFGQTAMFGLGGYCYGVMAINFVQDSGETGTALVAAVLFAAIFAALLGYFMFYARLGDVYLAIITLAVTLVLYTILASTAGPEYHIGDARLGGFNGMPAIPLLGFGVPGGDLAQPLSSYELYLFSVAAAGFVYIALRLLLSGPFGRTLAGIRENELRMELLGYDTRRYKLLAFSLGGAIAGLGGALFAVWGTFINPSVFTLAQAALVVIWVLVGGRGTLVGAFVGVIIVQWLTERVDNVWEGQTQLVLGAILILIVLVLPGGVIPTLGRLLQRGLTVAPPEWRNRILPGARRLAVATAPATRDVTALAAVAETSAAGGPETPSPGSPSSALEPPRELVLSTSELKRRFGGVVALDGVSLSFEARRAYAVIGPNGAGKSTFFNLLIGRYPPSGGTVSLSNREITRLQTFQRARLGLGIKLQVPSLFSELSVRENMWLASYAAGDTEAATARAEEGLRAVGLLERADSSALELSHGEQQWLEIAMVIAARPSIILLDEPTAGMTREETVRTVELITTLAREHTVIVVEHDMDFVRRLGAPVTMLHRGKVFTSGSFEEIRQNKDVIDIYLGRSARAEPA